MGITSNEYYENFGDRRLFLRCPAVLGETTYKPSRTAQDEAIDRHHTLTLGTFCGHSLMLGLIEGLEYMAEYLIPITHYDDLISAQFERVIAQVKMCIASIRYEYCRAAKLRIGQYMGTKKNEWGYYENKPEFDGWSFRGLLRGGRLSRHIVHWLQGCVEGVLVYDHPNCGKRVGIFETPVITDAVFQINLDRNMKLATAELGETLVETVDECLKTTSEQLGFDSLLMLYQAMISYGPVTEICDALPRPDLPSLHTVDPVTQLTSRARRAIHNRRLNSHRTGSKWRIPRLETDLQQTRGKSLTRLLGKP